MSKIFNREVVIRKTLAVTGAVTLSDALAAASAAITGAVTAASATVTGALKGASLTITDTGTAAATAGAATLSKKSGVITTEALTTAQNAIYTLTLTNTKIAATSIVLATVADGTNTQGTPMVVRVNPAAGSCVITVANKHATAEALNGTLKIAFAVIDVA